MSNDSVGVSRNIVTNVRQRSDLDIAVFIAVGPGARAKSFTKCPSPDTSEHSLRADE